MLEGESIKKDFLYNKVVIELIGELKEICILFVNTIDGYIVNIGE